MVKYEASLLNPSQSFYKQKKNVVSLNKYTNRNSLTLPVLILNLGLHKRIIRVRIRPPNAIIPAENPRLKILHTTRLPLRHPPKVYPLSQLPHLDASKENRRLHKDDAPLPRNPLVPEHDPIEPGDVEDGEDGHDAGDDGPEEEAVLPEVAGPLREGVLRLGLHAEEAAPEVHHLDGEEEREPNHGREAGGAGPEHQVAAGRVAVVAVFADLAVAEAVEDEDEAAEAEGCHPETVDEHVEHQLGGENALFQLVIQSGIASRIASHG